MTSAACTAWRSPMRGATPSLKRPASRASVAHASICSGQGMGQGRTGSSLLWPAAPSACNHRMHQIRLHSSRYASPSAAARTSARFWPMQSHGPAAATAVEGSWGAVMPAGAHSGRERHASSTCSGSPGGTPSVHRQDTGPRPAASGAKAAAAGDLPLRRVQQIGPCWPSGVASEAAEMSQF